MAEFIFKDMIKTGGLDSQYYVESAAVSDEEYGNPIYPPAKRCLSAHGVPFDPSKTARTVTAADYASFDRLICMDASNIRWLRRIIGEDKEGKISMMMSFAGSGRDVADPWYTGNFEATYSDITTACQAMLNADLNKKGSI